MTFSILGTCERTGKIGFAQATGTPAVGRRCAHVFPGKGVLTVQAGHNYYQLELAVSLYQAGYTPEKLIEVLSTTGENADHRQLAVLDLKRGICVKTGPKAFHWAGHHHSRSFVVAGNALVGPQVIQAMANAFEKSSSEELEERLLRAIEAGRDAGGQPTGQRSAVLNVFGEQPYPHFDLRVDVNLEPVGELRKGFDWYKALVPFYIECYEKREIAKYRDYLKSVNWPISPPS